MISGTKIMIIAGLTILLCSQAIFARFDVWEPENGIPIRQAPHIRWSGNASQNDNGEFCVVWSATVDGAQNVFAQMYDSECNALWEEGGIQVTNGNYVHHKPKVISAGEYGWYVGWDDYRNDIDSEYPTSPELYIQRITPDGDLAWNNNGIHYENFFIPSENGSFFAFWGSDSGLVARRFDHNRSSVWEENVTIADNFQIVISDGFAGLIVFFHAGEDYARCLNRINPDGELLWGNVDEGIEFIDSEDVHLTIKDILPDGNGGAFVIMKSRTEPGYQILGQHANSEGEIQWDLSGQVLVPDNVYQFDTHSSVISPENLVISWLTVDRYSPDQLRIKRIESSNGTAVFHWGDENYGMQLSEDWAWDNWLVPDNEGGVTVSWLSANPNYEVRGVEVEHLDEDGISIWDNPNFLPIRWENHTDQRGSNKIVTINTDELSIIVRRNPDIEQGGLYLQAFNLDSGEPQFEDDLPVIEGLAGDARNPLIVHSGNSAYICWEDQRLSVQGSLPYLQRVDLETGEALWTANGINIVPGFEYGNGIDYRSTYLSDLLPDGDGGAVVVWSQTDRNYEEQIHHNNLYFQRIDEDGNLPWGDQGYHSYLDIENMDELSWGGRAVPTDDGGIILIYGIFNYESYQRKIIGQKLNADGEPIWNPPYGITLIERDSCILNVYKMLEMDNGEFLILFTYSLSMQTNLLLYAIAFDEDGEHSWEEPLLVLPLNNTTIRSFYAEAIDEHIVVFTRVSDSAGDLDSIQAQCFDQNGELRWGDDGLTFESNQWRITTETISMVTGINNDFWLAWRREEGFEIFHYDLDFELLQEELILIEPRTGYLNHKLVPDGDGGVYMFWNSGTWFNDTYKYIHINSEGDIATEGYGDNGVYLTDAPYMQNDYDVASDGNGGALAAWSDYRGHVHENEWEDEDVYIMRIHDGTVGVAKGNKTNLPSNYSLESIYPNPFNPTTTIRVGLPHSAELSVSAYNILGQKITQLASGRYSAGYHKVVFNAGELSSGIYFIHAKVPGKMDEVRKVVLIR